MIRFYWCAQTRAFRILWLLEEAGLPYERVHIDIRNNEAKNAARFRAASPLGKVPAIEDGATRLWDSGAICAYIADQYPATRLAPPIGDPQRGDYLQWLLFTNSVLEPAMLERFAKLPSSPTSYGFGSFDSMLGLLRSGVAAASPWLIGERFTAADVLLGTSCHFLAMFGLVKNDPVLAPYVARCMARPAAQRAQQIESGTS
jgi:glutathione S-transferase